MNMLPSRWVHLDFHTSEYLPDVGRDFDKAQFQEALRVGHVNWITVFAKCHHSWSYYPTEVGNPHPTLQCDLLGGQIEASHEIGVRAPIYFTVGWSANDALWHPEWAGRNKDGSVMTMNYDVIARPDDPKPTFSWIFLCPSGVYRELILNQTRELCARYPVDGFFYDICFTSPIGGVPCYCDNCRAGMLKMGMDPANEADAARYHTLNWQSFMTDCNTIIHAKHPEATVFYNSATSVYTPQWYDWQTHYELEDLPTTWGGYDKFPIRAKHFANSGKQYTAMSGKFHTAWGEFGGFKHPDAIKFEGACMIAYGAHCCFGDQLHPLGAMDMGTYSNLGQAYEYVEQIEEYGIGGKMFANLGFWLSGDNADDQGTVNMLMESHIDFEVVTPDGDLSRFETMILPGAPCLTDETARKIETYLQSGGKVLVLGHSALNADRNAFMLETGAHLLTSAGFYDQDYTVVSDALATDLVTSPFLNYDAAMRVQLTDGEALASIREPYFDRTYKKFCSHQNTPNQPQPAEYPAAWRKGNMVCLPHRLGKIYYEHGSRVHRQLFINALRLLYTEQIVATELPSAGRVNLIHQPEKSRYVVHLMYGPPLQRGDCLVIEDLPTLTNVPVTLNVPEKITTAYLAPSKEEIALTSEGRGVRVTVPSVCGHAAVVFTY